jgi:hypothetical protein
MERKDRVQIGLLVFIILILIIILARVFVLKNKDCGSDDEVGPSASPDGF